MEWLASIARFEAWVLLGGLMAVVGYQLLTGRINLRGLLVDKAKGGFSPGRVQLLVLTVAGAGQYLMSAAGHAPDGTMPPVPLETLALVGGGNLIYLGAKTRAHLFPN